MGHVTGTEGPHRNDLPPAVRKWKAIAIMFANLTAMIVRDGIDPADAHREFLKIEEYRDTLSLDVPGVADAEMEMSI
jgi:hypothetical protein